MVTSLPFLMLQSYPNFWFYPYSPPRDILLNYKSFTEELALTFQTFKDRNYDIIIGGDKNIDLLKIKEKEFVNEYFDMIVSSGFCPCRPRPIPSQVKMPSMQRACKEHAIIKDAQRMQRGCQIVRNVNVQA